MINRPLSARFSTFPLTFSMIVAAQAVHAQAMPPGMKGWTYFTGINSTQQYVGDPVEACRRSAENHMRSPLIAMRSTPGASGMLDCKYQHMLGVPKGGEWYGVATLVCEAGYSPRSPGVCVKQAEAPAPSPDPLCCSEEDAGFSLGNPVQLTSGAKVQTETDLIAGPGDFLRIERTYRTLRKNWSAQSAGIGWSFSFDREFVVNRFAFSLPFVTGTFGDGSVFAFDLLPGGKLVSRYDKRVSLKALDANYNDWLLTNINGQVERYKNFQGSYRMVSAHGPSGGSATYSYDAEQLILISDSNGRSVKIGWRDGVVESIDGAEGGVRYEYQQASVSGQADITGMARLDAVHFHGRDGALVASRRYHHESESSRYLLTGITGENKERFATYAYNDAAKALLSEHAGGAGRYTFSYPTDLTRRVIDPLGTERIWSLTYPADSRGRVASESRPAGAGSAPASSKFEYANRGDLASKTDFNGNKTCFVNDAARGLETRRIAGLPAAVSCPVSANNIGVNTARMISTQWHPDWTLKSVVAEPYRLTSYVYNGERGADGQGVRCSDATLPNGKPVAVLCSRSIQPTTDNNGTLGFAAAKTGAARVWQYTYDNAGRLLTRRGPADAVGNRDALLLTYSADTTDVHTIGDLATATNGAGEVTQFREYGKDGLATNIKLPNGQIIKLEYGARQRLASRTVEDGRGASETTRYEYDDAGQLTRVTSADGSSMEYGYDAAHRLTDLRDGSGNTVHFTLDNIGNVIKQDVRGAGGELVATSKRTYDALNRLQKAQRDDQDAGMSYAYDRGGNLTKVTDPLGRATTQVFDSFDRVMTQILPAPASGAAAPVIGYGYSHQDDLLSVTDPRKLTTRYTVDGLGQQTSVISPDTGTTTTKFDGAGNPDFSTDAAARKTTYRFDAARRVTQIGSSIFEYGKDGSGATGRLTKMSDASGQTTYTYDGFGRLLTKSQSVGAGASAKIFATAYTYGNIGSSVGHVTSMTYPSGSRIDYVYSTDGRVKSLVLTAPGTSPVTILGDIRYLPFGGVRGWTWGNSSAASPNIYERKFDLSGRVVSFPLGHLANNGTVRTLSYDAAGRIRITKHTGAAGAALLDQRYDYDGLDRLTAFDGASTSQRFQYDANGNRTRATFGANTYVSTISPTSNRLASTTGPAPAKQNAYDAVGNLSNDGAIQYAYGSDGRLSSVVRSGVTTGYRYNAAGQRVAKIGVAGVLVNYAYDEMGRLLGEYDGAGRAIQETIYLGDLNVAVLKPDGASAVTKGLSTLGIYYVYADHIRTPRVLTRARDNKIVWRWDGADPFGLVQPDENPNRISLFTYNPRFPGQVFDKETNNHYNYFRDYDPQLGRYVQSDPIGLYGGMNTYSYVKSSPIASIDPLGLADINLFKPSDTVNHAGGQAWNISGVFTVAGHGNWFNMSDENDGTVFPDKLAKRIRNHPNFKDQPIMLGSCNTGLSRGGLPSFSQLLANYLNVPVTAALDNAYFGSKGLLGAGPNGPKGNPGPWKTFYPDPNYSGRRY
ncbi:MAG: RHS repeat-associated core domain-containing protein [Pseudomonadota bacterium]